MSRLAGKVAFVTGAARGQGRSHAAHLAREGADIIAIDVCRQMESTYYPPATQADLAETVRIVEATGRTIVASVVDVRDLDGVTKAVTTGVEQLGRLDVVVANAGICSAGPWNEVSPREWNEVIEVNLTGAWHTCAAGIPHLIAAGGGAIVLTSSTAGLKGLPFAVAYTASKHGVVGIMRSLANELAPHNIRVNTVHPTGVRTPMIDNVTSGDSPLTADPAMAAIVMNSLPVEAVEPEDVSNAVVFLCSDEARYITGLTMTVDAGNTNR